MTPEQTEEYQEWHKKLMALNDHINSLKVWNDYAEACQAEYDWLLKQDPRKKGKL